MKMGVESAWMHAFGHSMGRSKYSLATEYAVSAYS
jgi:hypothetical protein